ncbi:hypothetical protein [Marinobacter sp.]|uniref:hypothetical protein n=1 Tax=Marinobacter sp. TaxID=50741 RepID=UPI002B269868|nr:hypothetical protein [Marinobacter sp.]
MTNTIRGNLRVVWLIAAMGLSEVAISEEWMDLPTMDNDQLAEASGRQGVPMQWQLNENQQNALVTGNRLSGNSTTGNNLISDQAFQNMSGIATVIQNTGNQVVIQDSTQVNILINR